MTRTELARDFERHRPRLKAIAYRLLGSVPESEDAVQEAWLRLDRADQGEIENLGGWLTATVARVALDKLRARADAGMRRIARSLDEATGRAAGGPRHASIA